MIGILEPALVRDVGDIQGHIPQQPFCDLDPLAHHELGEGHSFLLPEDP